VIVSSTDGSRSGEVYKAKAKDPRIRRSSTPIVVLVIANRVASEIVSGACRITTGPGDGRDYIWQGAVQEQVQLDDGSALLLTIAHYYTPSGRLIQRDYSILNDGVLFGQTEGRRTGSHGRCKVHRSAESIRRRGHHSRREVPAVAR